jgi:hypothetical protein
VHDCSAVKYYALRRILLNSVSIGSMTFDGKYSISELKPYGLDGAIVFSLAFDIVVLGHFLFRQPM